MESIDATKNNLTAETQRAQTEKREESILCELRVSAVNKKALRKGSAKDFV